MSRRAAVIGCFLSLLAVSAPGFAQSTADTTCDLSGYSPSVRPDPPGTPTDVGVGLTLIDLGAINDVNQTITLDALLTTTSKSSYSPFA